MALVKAFPAADLWGGEMVGVDVSGVRILLVREDDQILAFADRCPHMATRLSRGRLEDGIITCAAHGWQFDSRSGCGVNPVLARLSTFPVVVDGADILVDVDRCKPALCPFQGARVVRDG